LLTLLLDTALAVGLAIGLVSGRISAARIFAAFTILVIITGRVPFDEAAALLVSPAIIAVISLVVVASSLTKLPGVARVLFGTGKAGPRGRLARYLGVAGLASAVTPNTAVVGALMGPATRRADVDPHHFLLPLSYMSLAGGMLTPFGTSASLMVVGRAADSGLMLGVLDFAGPGAAAAIAVFLCLALAAPIILKQPDSAREEPPEVFYIEARIPEESPLIGRSVSANKLRHLASFYLAEIVRSDHTIKPVRPNQHIQAGDRLIFVGDISHIEELRAFPGLDIQDGPRTGGLHAMHHAVVASGGVLEGRTLKEVEFRSRFDASVMAVKRGEERLSGKLGDIVLRAGDVLVLASGADFTTRDNLRANLHILDVDDPGPMQLDARNAWILGGAFGLFLVFALFQLAPFALIAFLLAALTIAMNWTNPREARRIFPFDLVIILWGAVLLSELVIRSGASEAAASAIQVVASDLPDLVAVIVIFFFAWLLTELFSNASAALTALPVALETASKLDAAPEPFALAVAFGASASFLMPFGYQTHLMVMTPGRYRLTDFWRLGGTVFFAYAASSLSAIALIHFS
jgi:di/tricarboxylate transporter